MNDAVRDRAKLLAKGLGDRGISNDEPPMKPSIRALNAAAAAFNAIGAGAKSEWRERMEARRIDERSRKESDRKLAGLCSRALKNPYLPESLREEVQFAWGYFNAKSEI